MKIYRNSFKGIMIAAFSMLALSACSDWTETESIDLGQPDITNQNPELYAKYLQNLREYKNRIIHWYMYGLIIVKRYLLIGHII